MDRNNAQLTQSTDRVKVSVVMSIYNFSRHFIRGIESTLKQSYSDFEFIIVDDGSDKQTKEISRRYAESDKRIQLFINEKHMKLASSLNRGVQKAKGVYIARADANIDYHRDRIKKQVDFMENHPDVDVLGSNFYWAIEGKSTIELVVLPESHQQIIQSLSRVNCICHPSVVFRKDRLLPFGPYKEGFGKCQDYYLWMKTRKSVRFHNIQEPLLVKWHRENPWKNRVLEYFFNDIRSRIAGLKTSPQPIKDAFYFYRCFKYFFQI